MNEPEHQDNDVEPRPWEEAGNVRRDCAPYEGYATHTLAEWSGWGLDGLPDGQTEWG